MLGTKTVRNSEINISNSVWVDSEHRDGTGMYP